MTDQATEQAATEGRSKLAFFIPVAIFGVVALFFVIALWSGDPQRLPSALIDKPTPQFTLPPLAGVTTKDGKPIPGFSGTDLAAGQVTVVTVWSSTCITCAQEQPTLMAFKAEHPVRVYSINYKDTPAEARRFLARFGNPFDAIGDDSSGRVSIDWGVYGTPETFVVDGRGVIVYKYVGPLTRSALTDELLPAIDKARKNG